MNPLRPMGWVFSLAVATTCIAQPAPSVPVMGAPMTVVHFALDGKRTAPYVVLTHPNEATAIEVPYPVENIAGRGFTTDPTKVGGDFYVQFYRGDRLLYVSPLAVDVTRTLHVVMNNGQDYPLELRPAAPQYAFRRVVFVDPEAEQAALSAAAEQAQQQAAAQRFAQVQRKRTAPKQNLAPASEAAQIGLIHFMQMLANLPAGQAERAVAANPTLSFARRDAEPEIEAGEYNLRPYFVVRNEAMKALGICVGIKNNTQRRLTFIPDSFVLRTGDFVYPQTAGDFNPTVEAGAETTAFFVIARTPDGSPILLDPTTPMQPSLYLAKSVNPKPAHALDVSDVLGQEVQP